MDRSVVESRKGSYKTSLPSYVPATGHMWWYVPNSYPPTSALNENMFKNKLTSQLNVVNTCIRHCPRHLSSFFTARLKPAFCEAKTVAAVVAAAAVVII